MRGRTRAILIGGAAVLLLLAGGIALVLKTRPAGAGVVSAAGEGERIVAPAARAELVEAFAPLHFEILRLGDFWGNQEALARAQKLLDELRDRQQWIDADAASELIDLVDGALQSVRDVNEEALAAWKNFDRAAGIGAEGPTSRAAAAQALSNSVGGGTQMDTVARQASKDFLDQYRALRSP